MVVVAALVGLGVTSLRQANFTKSKQIASSLADTIAEEMRSYRDANSINDFPLPDNACNPVSVSSFSVYGVGDCSWIAYPERAGFSYRISSLNLPGGVSSNARLLRIQVRFATSSSSSGYEIVTVNTLLSKWVAR